MTHSKFYNYLVQKYPFSPTYSQKILLEMLAKFITNENFNELFLLKGYAGTGKTTTISIVVNSLYHLNKKAVLLAPTGRAAKVLSGYSNKKSFTIHKGIYFTNKNKNGNIAFSLKKNRYTDTLFIIDEASMISDTSNSNSLTEHRSLLSDVIQYVYSGKNCKMILVGDTAQLPPVRLDVSPALKAEHLSFHYKKEVIEFELDEVVRQDSDSGILINATHLREIIAFQQHTNFQFSLEFPDVIRLTDGYDIEDALNTAYDTLGIEDTAIIVRSNKRANLYNQQIRNRILGLESEISTGDIIMVVKNNYFWLDENSEAGFIANGDSCEILQIYRQRELYNFHFAEVKLRMIDYPNQEPFDTVLLLDTLHSEKPSLTYEENNALYQEVLEDYKHLHSRYQQMVNVKNNPYFNALQIKFSYAITCHKSQGGQWNTVFIEQPYLPEGQSKEYWRWLYTAITRAKKKVYLLGFDKTHFEESF